MGNSYKRQIIRDEMFELKCELKYKDDVITYERQTNKHLRRRLRKLNRKIKILEHNFASKSENLNDNKSTVRAICKNPQV